MARPATALTTLTLLLFALAQPGCSDDTQQTADAGPTIDVGVDSGGGGAVFGAGCVANDDCAEGLFCMQSEFAPAGWCTVFCPVALAGDHCVDPALKGVDGLCIQMPSGFRGPVKPFCARTCQNTAECTDIWSAWEACEKPSYKEENRYNNVPTRVCAAPSAHGQVQVDPIACTWEAAYSQPKFQEAKQVCKAYCTYLKSCQLFDTKKENYDCCTWRCFQKATPKGLVDEDRMSELKCYTQAFYVAYAGTPRICTGPPVDCGEPDPMRERK